MTSNYFKKDLGHIFDLAERYDFVKDELGYTLQFFAAVYDLSLTELEFLIDSIHFSRSEIFKNLDSTGFFKGEDVKRELFSLALKGYLEIETKNESEDNYYYSYTHTEKAKKLAEDMERRLSSILDEGGRGEDLVDFAYMDVVNKLDLLFDDLRVMANDNFLLKIKPDDNLDSEYTRRYELVRDIKKTLNKKYPYLSIINIDEYKEVNIEDLDEDDENFEEDFDEVIENFLKDGRHLVEIEYTLKSRRQRAKLLVNAKDYGDVIEIGNLDDYDMADGEAFTHFVMLMDDFNRDHKKIKEKLRNLYDFIAPAYDLTLGEFEFCLYYTTIYTSSDEEIYDIDGYFIDDSKKIVASLIEKDYIYQDEDGFTLTEKSDAVFKHIGGLFSSTMEKNKASYKDLIEAVNCYDTAGEILDDITDDFAYRFSFEDFNIEDKLSDEIDEYSLGVPLDKAVCVLLRKKFTNPKVLSLTDEGDFIKVIFTTDDRKGEVLAGFLNKNGINEM